MKRRLLRRPVSYTELAGWLFADLLLGLAVIGLASQPIMANVDISPSPSPTQELVEILDPEPIEVEFQVEIAGLSSNNSETVRDLREKLLGSRLKTLQSKGAKSWMVLIFSGGANSCKGTESTSLKAFQILKKTLPSLITRETVPRPFIRLDCSNSVKFEVYKYKYVPKN